MSVPSGPPQRGPGDVQAAYAAALVDEWARAGVTHAVVCPGSRSAPLAVALARHPRLSVVVRLDERSAGFTALGIGLATGRPAVVVTTSGTAAAELHAAVVEADLARVPLLVCTADRPPELHGVGAPQTIDQLRLYGTAVRWFADPGVPDPVGRPGWRSLGSRAAAECLLSPSGPGPVHLNLAFREPLVGDASLAGVPEGREGGAPWHAVIRAPSAPDPSWLGSRAVGSALRPGGRGVIVAGGGCGGPGPVLAMAATLGWPVLADPRSGLRRTSPWVVAAADGVLRSARFVAGHLPEVVVRLGDAWASKVVAGFVSRAVAGGSRYIVVDDGERWPDPGREAVEVVRTDPARFAEAVAAARAGAGGERSSWLAAWQEAEARAQSVLDECLDPASTGVLTEPALARHLFRCLPDEATLVVSSSMPVRDLEAYGAPRQRPPRVVANRGANGIDGVVSTALGVALAGGPVVALVGDLAFLHDASALTGVADGAAGPVDLTVVVADNVGGAIFSFLPQAEALDAPTFEELFATPPRSDPARVAAGYGWPVHELGPDGWPDELAALLARRPGLGVSVVRARLPDHRANREVHRRLHEAVVDAVDDVGTARA